jgi:hypothetical protein
MTVDIAKSNRKEVKSMSFSINMTEIFSYASMIVNALMPVVLVTGGIALGFVVVGKIISAFRA